jgi:hypothetical protein
MSEFLEANGILVLVFAFALLCLIAIMAPIIYFVYQWRSVRQTQIEAGLQKAEMDAYLKQQMLDRGMSVSEIKTVLESGSGGSGLGEMLKKFGLEPGQWRNWKGNCHSFGKMWGNWDKSRAKMPGQG